MSDDSASNGHSLYELVGGLSIEVQRAVGRIESRMSDQELVNLQQQKWLTEDPNLVGMAVAAKPVIKVVKWITAAITGLLGTVAAAVVGSCALDLQKTNDLEEKFAAHSAALEEKLRITEELLAKNQAENKAQLDRVEQKASAAKRAAQVNQAVVVREVKKVQEEVGVEETKKRWYERLLP